MKKNLFIREYHGAAENILTESLMDFLSNIDISVLKPFLKYIGVRGRIDKSPGFEMQLKGRGSIPDAAIYDKSNFYVSIEVKRIEGGLRDSQLENHFETLKYQWQRNKILLIITNDINEPIEFKWFKDSHHARGVRTQFLSWSEIVDYFDSLPKHKLNKKDAFLVAQYLEYLEDEEMTKSKWSGFKKHDEATWIDFCRFHANLERLLTDIHDHIEKKEEWDVRPVQTDAGALWFHCSVWGGRGKKCFLYIGIELTDYKKKPMYVVTSWHWSKKLKNKFLQSNAFSKVKQRLTRRGYEPGQKSGNDWFWKILEFKNIIRTKGADNQKKLVLRYVDGALADFKSCGISRLMNRV